MAERRLAKVEPPELGALLDVAERSRVGDWSLRSSLTRFAQPEPVRVAAMLDLVRRMDAAALEEAKALTSGGQQVWDDLQAAGDDARPDGLVGLLAAMAEVDRFGDELATWASNWSTDRPTQAFDDVVADVKARLEELGVPEQGPPPAGVRGRG